LAHLPTLGFVQRPDKRREPVAENLEVKLHLHLRLGYDVQQETIIPPRTLHAAWRLHSQPG
jgi:hypothetical protein